MEIRTTVHELVRLRRDWRVWVWAVVAVFWVLRIWRRVYESPFSPSSFEIPYLWLGLVPLLLIVAHCVLPTRLGWLLIGLVIFLALGYHSNMRFEEMLFMQDGAKWMPGREWKFASGTVLSIAFLTTLLLLLRPGGWGVAPDRRTGT